MTLRPDDLIAAIKYLVRLRNNEPDVEIDDIDHLGNRRLRTIDELASDELRKGFLKLRRTVQERMSLKDLEDMTPRSLVNPRASPRPSSTSSAAANFRRSSTRPTPCRC